MGHAAPCLGSAFAVPRLVRVAQPLLKKQPLLAALRLPLGVPKLRALAWRSRRSMLCLVQVNQADVSTAQALAAHPQANSSARSVLRGYQPVPAVRPPLSRTTRQPHLRSNLQCHLPSQTTYELRSRSSRLPIPVHTGVLD